MLRIRGRTHDEKMFPGIITMMTLLVGLVAFGGVPVMVSNVVLHTDAFLLYVFIIISNRRTARMMLCWI